MATDNDPAVELEQQTPAPDVTPADPPAVTPAPADPPQDLLSGDPEPIADAAPNTAWPDDWRDQMSGGNEQIGRLLSRYRSPQNVGKALNDARVRLSQQSSPTLPVLSENPTEQEITEYRQALNIPEESSGYEVHLPEYLQRDDGSVS